MSENSYAQALKIYEEAKDNNKKLQDNINARNVKVTAYYDKVDRIKDVISKLNTEQDHISTINIASMVEDIELDFHGNKHDSYLNNYHDDCTLDLKRYKANVVSIKAELNDKIKYYHNKIEDNLDANRIDASNIDHNLVKPTKPKE